MIFFLNEVCKYSITRKFESDQIIKIVKMLVKGSLNNYVLTDATACAGGDTIYFSKHVKLVNSVEINKDNFNLLYKNCLNFKRKNIVLYNYDYLKIYKYIKQDIIYIDPEWVV